jgi:hypothetical protein
LGASIDASTGVFQWTPSEAQGPGEYFIALQAHFSGTLVDTAYFTVVVNEVPSAPTLTLPPEFANPVEVLEGSALSFTAVGSGEDSSAPYLWPLHTQTFTNLSLAPWTAYSRKSNKNWEAKEFGDRTYAQMLGVGADVPSDDWLISTNLDYRGTTAQVLSFESLKQFTGPDLTVLISTNYSGTGDPTNATWQTLAAPLSPGDEVLFPSGDVDLSTFAGQPKVFIAFRYTSTGTTAGTAALWQVGNVRVTATWPGYTETLTYSLEGEPSGATIDPSTGDFAWTPSEAQGPGSYTMKVRVSDDATITNVVQSADQTITIVVQEVNQPPLLPTLSIPAQHPEEVTLRIIATASDPDLPPNSLTYELLEGPEGAVVDGSGVIAWTPTESQGPGIHSFRLKVTDSSPDAANEHHLSVETNFTVTVLEVNRAPSITSISPQSLNEGAELTVIPIVTDPDLPPNHLTFRKLSGPETLTVNPTNGAIGWVTTEADGPGSYTVTIAVDDDGVPPLNGTSQLLITVREVNVAPVLPVLGDVSTPELKLLTIVATATDDDAPANALTYDLIEKPEGATVDANGVIAWTPSEAQGPATHAFRIRVTDNSPQAVNEQHLVAVRAFMVAVAETNQPPVLAAIPDGEVRGTNAFEVTAHATDLDWPTNQLTYSLMQKPPGATIDPSSGLIRWTPTLDQIPSTNTFEVLVTDNGTNPPSLTDSTSFTVMAWPAHRPPVWAFPAADTNLVVVEHSTLTFTNEAMALDGGPTVTFELLSEVPGAELISTNGVFTWTPSETQGPSTNELFFVAIDSGTPPARSTNRIVVTVLETNAAPMLVPIPDQEINEGDVLNLVVQATDQDFPTNTLTYSIVSGPPEMSIDPATGQITWLTREADGPGSYAVTVRVFDNGSPAKSDSKSFNVVVREVNTAPVLTVPTNQVVDEETTLVVTNVATDSDLPANPLTFALVSPPDGATINPTNGVFSWRPSEAQGPGTNTFVVKVADNSPNAANAQELSATNSFTVIVNEVNTAPTLPAIASQLVDELKTLIVTDTATDTDLPANPLSYILLEAPTNATIDVNGIITWTPSEAQGPSTNTFTVRVTDTNAFAVNETQLSATNTFTVIVNEVNELIITVFAKDGTLTLEFPTVDGRRYQIEFRNDLTAGFWQPLIANIDGTGQLCRTDIPITATPAQQFYRIALLP